MLIQDFYERADDEDTQSLMVALKQKLDKLNWSITCPIRPWFPIFLYD